MVIKTSLLPSLVCISAGASGLSEDAQGALDGVIERLQRMQSELFGANTARYGLYSGDFTGNERSCVRLFLRRGGI